MAFCKVSVTDEVKTTVRKLPGNICQRVLKAISDLSSNQHPPQSKALDISDVEGIPSTKVELRRIRLESWRVIYLVEPDDELVSVLAVRKRPPYRYEDLSQLIRDHLS